MGPPASAFPEQGFQSWSAAASFHTGAKDDTRVPEPVREALYPPFFSILYIEHILEEACSWRHHFTDGRFSRAASIACGDQVTGA